MMSKIELGQFLILDPSIFKEAFASLNTSDSSILNFIVDPLQQFNINNLTNYLEDNTLKRIEIFRSINNEKLLEKFINKAIKYLNLPPEIINSEYKIVIWINYNFNFGDINTLYNKFSDSIKNLQLSLIFIN